MIFFNRLAIITNQWKVDEQMKTVAAHNLLLDDAVMIMLSIGQSVANNRLHGDQKDGDKN